MIVPVKCFGCGKELANLYRVYLEKVKERKLEKNIDPSKIIYLTKEPMGITPEKEIMDALRLNKICCRNIIMTVVEI
jgi:DNA-directed RNA polymerase I, II, and III subunit RPABC5